MNSLFHIEIPKRNTHCSAEGERLIPGMEIYSLLLEEGPKSLKRHDFCSLCWRQKERAMPAWGYWKSKIESRKMIKGSSRIERALVLLRELQHQEGFDEEIFVLCLFLSRARQLILRQEFQKEGSSYQLYERAGEEEYFTIKSIRLSQIQIEDLQQSLACKLQS